MSCTCSGSTVSSQKTCVQSRSSFAFFGLAPGTELASPFMLPPPLPETPDAQASMVAVSCHIDNLSMKLSNRSSVDSGGGPVSFFFDFFLLFGDDDDDPASFAPSCRSLGGHGPGNESFKRYRRIWIFVLGEATMSMGLDELQIKR